MNFFLDGEAEEASTCNSQAIEPIKHTQGECIGTFRAATAMKPISIALPHQILASQQLQFHLPAFLCHKTCFC